MKERFFSFLKACPTALHVSSYLEKAYLEKGFLPLTLDAPWVIKPGKNYFYKKEGTFFAVSIPHLPINELRYFACHTDSPGLKLKPHPFVKREGALFIALTPYGSPIIGSWLNRDLQIAGRILTESGKEKLVLLKEPKCVIAEMPPHLSLKENESIHLENELLALLSLKEQDPKTQFERLFGEKVLSHDLFLVPAEEPETLLDDNSLVAGARLDNLASVFALLEGFQPSKESRIQCALFFDHEEIGSKSECGARSTLFARFLETLFSGLDLPASKKFALQEKALLLSIDNAHALHPLYTSSFSENHAPRLGEGIALKVSSSLKYGTSSIALKEIIPTLRKGEIPFQFSAVRNDLKGGSTLGPFAAAELGAQTIDLGLPQLSMHSSRELISLKDLKALQSSLQLLSS